VIVGKHSSLGIQVFALQFKRVVTVFRYSTWCLVAAKIIVCSVGLITNCSRWSRTAAEFYKINRTWVGLNFSTMWQKDYWNSIWKWLTAFVICSHREKSKLQKMNELMKKRIITVNTTKKGFTKCKIQACCVQNC
jgi:hypothetical protein